MTAPLLRLHPPETEIPSDDPFKHALFGRKRLAESLTTLVRNVEDGMVIFVDAPYGEGKSTFAKMWRTDLIERQKLPVIYFDAYAADHVDDPFVCFAGEIAGLVKKHYEELTAAKQASEDFKKKAAVIGAKLGGLALRLGVKAVTANVIGKAEAEEVKELLKDAFDDSAEVTSDLVEKSIEEYASQRDLLNDFKKSLANLAAIIRQKQGFPLLIIVDELDRCRPSFALALLERIKHLFDVPGVSFVLLVYRKQIENHIRAVYGTQDDARGYLLKFGTLFVELPRERDDQEAHPFDRYNFCERLLEHHGFAERVRDATNFATAFGMIAEHLCLTLRETEKAFGILTLYFTSPPPKQGDHDLITCLLVCLKIKKPDLYGEVRSGSLSRGNFAAEFRLDAMKPPPPHHPIDLDYAIGLINYAFCSPTEINDFRAKTGTGQPVPVWFRRLDEFRALRGLISRTCLRIDQFSLVQSR